MFVADTITITTKCSGGCSHCPFSHPDMEKLNLDLKSIKHLVEKSNSPLLVLSGGELFEYDQNEHLFQYLTTSTKRFRIATGGHLDLQPYIARLKNLGGLEGISLGTDIIFRQDSFNKIEMWIDNLNLLIKNNIPYSLTFTILDNDDLAIEEKLKFFSQGNLLPQFIYLRRSKNAKTAILDLIKNTFSGATIINDLID